VKEGDIILTQIPQSDGTLKTRPALVLRELPPFRDLLVCGISTQTHQAVRGFDEVILRTDSDFSDTGLMSDSVARLGFLAVLPRSRFSTPPGHHMDHRVPSRSPHLRQPSIFVHLSV